MKKCFEELQSSYKDVFSRYEELILDQAELINNAADLLKMTSEMYSYIARLLQDAEASEIVKKNGEHMLAIATELAKHYDAVQELFGGDVR